MLACVNTGKVSKVRSYSHSVTLSLDPGGFNVAPDDQLTNMWTCLCD